MSDTVAESLAVHQEWRRRYLAEHGQGGRRTAPASRSPRRRESASTDRAAKPSWYIEEAVDPGGRSPHYSISHREQFGDTRIIFTADAAADIKTLAARHPTVETGGVLFGHREPRGTLKVTHVGQAGPNCQRSSGSYRADGEHDAMLAEELYASGLVELGSWHSHVLQDNAGASITSPSGPDLQRGAQMLGVVREDHRGGAAWNVDRFAEVIVAPGRHANWARSAISLTGWAITFGDREQALTGRAPRMGTWYSSSQAAIEVRSW